MHRGQMTFAWAPEWTPGGPPEAGHGYEQKWNAIQV